MLESFPVHLAWGIIAHWAMQMPGDFNPSLRDSCPCLLIVERALPPVSQLREHFHKGGGVLGPREMVAPVDDKVRHASHSSRVQL